MSIVPQDKRYRSKKGGWEGGGEEGGEGGGS